MAQTPTKQAHANVWSEPYDRHYEGYVDPPAKYMTVTRRESGPLPSTQPAPRYPDDDQYDERYD